MQGGVRVKSKGFLVVLLGWLLLATGSVGARTLAELSPGTSTLGLTPYLAYHRDVAATAGPDEMFAKAQRGGFEPLPADGPTFGFQDGAFWVHARVVNRNPAEPRWLLPMLCKAGNVTKSAIGSIRIFDTETIFGYLNIFSNRSTH